MLSVSVVMLGRQWLHYAVKGAISLQIDVLGSEWIKKVHRGSEVIEIRKFCPPNQIRAFFIFFVPRPTDLKYRGLQREEKMILR